MVRWIERVALTYVYTAMCKISSQWEAAIWAQGNQSGHLWQSRGVQGRGRFRREGTYVYLWLIHHVAWQKSTQYWKVIILQLKKHTCHTHIRLMLLGLRIHIHLTSIDDFFFQSVIYFIMISVYIFIPLSIHFFLYLLRFWVPVLWMCIQPSWLNFYNFSISHCVIGVLYISMIGTLWQICGMQSFFCLFRFSLISLNVFYNFPYRGLSHIVLYFNSYLFY